MKIDHFEPLLANKANLRHDVPHRAIFELI